MPAVQIVWYASLPVSGAGLAFWLRCILPVALVNKFSSAGAVCIHGWLSLAQATFVILFCHS